MKKVFVILAGLFFSSSISAQVQHSGWFASFNTFRLNDQFSLHFDAQVRSTNEVRHVGTILLRPGLNYHISKQLTATAGYGFISNRRTFSNITDNVAEHRIWEQLIYSHKLKRVSVAHRLRVEQRFLPTVSVGNNELNVDDYNLAHRVRYFIRNVVPFEQGQFTNGLFFALQNEIFLNTFDKTHVNGKTFDQNRLYIAFGYRLPRKIDVEAGYLNQYIDTRNSHINNHILQLAVYKRL